MAISASAFFDGGGFTVSYCWGDYRLDNLVLRGLPQVLNTPLPGSSGHQLRLGIF